MARTQIQSVTPGGPAHQAGVRPGETLVAINGHPIVDVLDYKFYSYDPRLELRLRELAEQEDEACLLLRRSDLLPLYAAGDLTAVLGVGVDTLRNDLAAVLTQLQTPEEGRRF